MKIEIAGGQLLIYILYIYIYIYIYNPLLLLVGTISSKSSQCLVG